MIVTLVAILVSIGAIVINPSPKNPSEQAEAEAEEYNKTGYTYSDLGNYSEAIECYKKALYLNRIVDAYYNLRTAYDDLGNQEEAIKYYEKTIELKPYYALAYYSMGWVHFKLSFSPLNPLKGNVIKLRNFPVKKSRRDVISQPNT